MGTARTVMGATATLVVGTLLLGGCGGSEGPGAAPAVTSRPATSLSTTSTFPPLRAAALPACPPGATGFTTLPDWLTGALPTGTALTKGSTGSNDGLPEGSTVEFTTVLVGPEAGGQLQTLVVHRRPGSTPVAPGWSPTGPQLSTVRGRPGTVGQTVSRSGAGPTTAVWEEDGASWTATSSLGVDALAQQLDRMSLATDGVDDPGGSFTQVGAGPRYAAGRQRVTELVVRTAASSPTKERVLYVRIDPAAPDTVGTLQLPVAGVTSTTTVDGRVVLLNPSQATSSTDDGSQVEVRSYDGESRPTPMDRATATAVLAGLHRRGPADAQVVDRLPVGDAGPDGAVPPGFCREG